MITYLEELFEAGILIPSGVDGVYGKSKIFEDIVGGLERVITKLGAYQKAEFLRFPPALPLSQMKTSEYLKSFPQLAGTVHCFCGNERDHMNMLQCIEENDDSWAKKQEISEVVLTPAACYPVYPLISKRGIVPSEGSIVDVMSYCFRHEPSIEPTRMQLFRMREYVKIGTPDQVYAFRQEWMEHGVALIKSLGVPCDIDVANDPFFGRGGKVVADSQRKQELKFELLITIDNPNKPVACLSFNYHLDHFGDIFKINTIDGEKAHTACVGFGLERITLALLKHHGFIIEKWPAHVIDTLGLESIAIANTIAALAE